MKINLDDFSKAGRCDVSRALRFFCLFGLKQGRMVNICKIARVCTRKIESQFAFCKKSFILFCSIRQK